MNDLAWAIVDYSIFGDTLWFSNHLVADHDGQLCSE